MLNVCHAGVSMGRGSLRNEFRCTHEHCPGVGPCCSRTYVMKEDQYILDEAHSSSRTVTHVSRRTQINTGLDNTPQTRERCQGHRRHVQQSPTYPKKRLAKSVVSGRHHARGASERMCRQPRSMSCTTPNRDRHQCGGGSRDKYDTHAIVAAASF